METRSGKKFPVLVPDTPDADSDNSFQSQDTMIIPPSMYGSPDTDRQPSVPRNSPTQLQDGNLPNDLPGYQETLQLTSQLSNLQDQLLTVQDVVKSLPARTQDRFQPDRPEDEDQDTVTSFAPRPLIYSGQSTSNAATGPVPKRPTYRPKNNLRSNHPSCFDREPDYRRAQPSSYFGNLEKNRPNPRNIWHPAPERPSAFRYTNSRLSQATENFVNTQPPARRQEYQPETNICMFQETSNYRPNEPRAFDQFQPIHQRSYPDHLQMNRLDQQGPSSTWKMLPKLPLFYGKVDEWESFWVQFMVCAKSQKFSKEEIGTHLMMCLKGSALQYAATLDFGIIENTDRLIEALKKRFGHSTPAQTHRASLSAMRKTSSETLQDFASRIQVIMMKAYPDIDKTDTFEQLAIQQFLNGIPDQELAFDVIKLSPTTLAEAVDRLVWLESCKQSIKKKTGSLRKVNIQDKVANSNNEEDEQEVRRINGKKFVTEERFMQLQRDNNNRTFKRFNQLLQDFKESLLKTLRGATHSNKDDPKVNQHNASPVICFECNDEGHIRSNCPNRNIESKKSEEIKKHYNHLNSKGLSLLAKPQPKW